MKLSDLNLIDMLNWNARYNWGLWAHLLASILYGKALLLFQIDSVLIVCSVLSGAVVWEVVELWIEYNFKSYLIEKNYGSVKNWIYDCIGDITIALVGVLVIVI